MLKLALENKTHEYIQSIQDWTSSKEGVWSGFKLSKIRFDWSPNRVTSRGGMYASGPGISIAMHRYGSNRLALEAFRVYEYKSFDNDPDIGGFFTRDKMDGLKMIVCHEIAHACQFYLYKKNNFRDAPHGDTFKHLYKEIRQKFLNPFLPEQTSVRDIFCKQAVDTTKLAYSEL